MIMTTEEQHLLQKMDSGALDGIVGNSTETSGGSTVWTEIKDGNPVVFKRGPVGKFFNGKENERYEGALTIKQKWTTDEEKIAFLRKFGWLIKDDEVKAYSAKYKPSRR